MSDAAQTDTRRWVALGLLALSSLAAGFAESQALLIAARAVQGVGAAILAASGLAAMMGRFAEGEERNRALGIWAAAAGSGGSVGLLLGGLLTDGPGWEWVFWVNVPIGLIGALAAPVLLTEASARRPRRLDVSRTWLAGPASRSGFPASGTSACGRRQPGRREPRRLHSLRRGIPCFVLDSLRASL
jgi:MFS family permease